MINSKEEKALNIYFTPNAKRIRDLCLYPRSFIVKDYPDANRLIYNGYNAVNLTLTT